MQNRTDMAMELVEDVQTQTIDALITRSDITIDAQTARKLNKPTGKYSTIESSIIAQGMTMHYDRLVDALAQALTEYMGKAHNILIIGLGNPNLTADALGSKVFDNLIITRHVIKAFKGQDIPKISGFCPNVMGVTGIESYDIVKGVVDKIKPDLVIVVDSLASATVSRLACAFQICSSGITPGSGVCNHRKRLDRSTLGVKVISIGVPMVVYASTIIADALSHAFEKDQLYREMPENIMGLIVTPKDIDVLVEECGKIIASAINRAAGLAHPGIGLGETCR